MLGVLTERMATFSKNGRLRRHHLQRFLTDGTFKMLLGHQVEPVLSLQDGWHSTEDPVE